jgi:hypothetical protein
MIVSENLTPERSTLHHMPNALHPLLTFRMSPLMILIIVHLRLTDMLKTTAAYPDVTESARQFPWYYWSDEENTISWEFGTVRSTTIYNSNGCSTDYEV